MSKAGDCGKMLWRKFNGRPWSKVSVLKTVDFTTEVFFQEMYIHVYNIQEDCMLFPPYSVQCSQYIVQCFGTLSWVGQTKHT